MRAQEEGTMKEMLQGTCEDEKFFHARALMAFPNTHTHRTHTDMSLFFMSCKFEFCRLFSYDDSQMKNIMNDILGEFVTFPDIKHDFMRRQRVISLNIQFNI